MADETYTSNNSTSPPNGTTSATIRCLGGAGAAGSLESASYGTTAGGGNGGDIEVQVSVSSSDTLYLRFPSGGNGGAVTYSQDKSTVTVLTGGDGGDGADARLNGTSTGNRIVGAGGAGGGGAAGEETDSNLYSYHAGSGGNDDQDGQDAVGNGERLSGVTASGGTASSASGPSGDGGDATDNNQGAAGGGGGGGWIGGSGGGAKSAGSDIYDLCGAGGGGGGTTYDGGSVSNLNHENHGQNGGSAEVRITWNGNPPTAVSNLQTTAAGSDQINLSWTDNATTEDGYRIYRGTSSGNLTQIDTIGANSTSYSDTGLTMGELYYYEVRPYNTFGETNSTEVSAAPTVTTPQNFSVDSIFFKQADLSWDSVSGIDSYNIYRDGVQIDSVSSGTTSYTDTGLSTTTSYTWHVTAVANDSESSNSNQVTDTTGGAAPTSLSLDASVEDQITLTWTDNTSLESGFEIHRNTSSGIDTSGTPVTTTAANATAYTDTGLVDGEKYWYQIVAVDSRGDIGNDSTEESAITVLPPPGNLTASVNSSENAELSWNKADDNNNGGIDVERSADGGINWIDIATNQPPSTTSFTDTSVTQGNQYQYTIERNTNHTSATSTVTIRITNLGSVISTNDGTIDTE